jgi:lipoprotein-anchoring transpeptidase ErfK/SrfK
MNIKTIFILSLLLAPFSVSAAEDYFNFDATISTLSGSQQILENFSLPFDKIQSIAELDLGNDGTSELIIGSPQGYEPRIYLLRQDGTLINSWLAYGENFKGGVEVATGDLDGDGTPEIITSPAGEGGPHVRIFDGFGNLKFNPGFFVDDKKYRGSVFVDTIRDSSTKNAAILTLTNSNNIPTISIFNNSGTKIKSVNLPEEFLNIYSLSSIDLGGDSLDEFIISSRNKNNTDMLYLFRTDGSLINSFKTENPGEFVTKPTPKEDGGEDLLISYKKTPSDIYNGYGNKVQKPINISSPGGIIGLTVYRNNSPRILAIQKRVKTIENKGKAIVIDLSEQRLSNYEDGYRVVSHIVSTGKSGYNTPVGEYDVKNKIDRAFSKTYGLYMPFWMAFTYNGYGIHELPEWPGGYKEGEDHLGIPVSHGCVRLGVNSAEQIYNWSEVGTPVIVQE